MTIEQIVPDNAENNDSWKGYDGLVDVGYDKHYRGDHSKDEFSDFKGRHVNGIENFWSFTKRRMQRKKDVRKTFFELFLKECEWQYNRSNDQLGVELKMLLHKEIKRQEKEVAQILSGQEPYVFF